MESHNRNLILQNLATLTEQKMLTYKLIVYFLSWECFGISVQENY